MRYTAALLILESDKTKLLLLSQEFSLHYNSQIEITSIKNISNEIKKGIFRSLGGFKLFLRQSVYELM